MISPNIGDLRTLEGIEKKKCRRQLVVGLKEKRKGDEKKKMKK